MNRPEKMNGLYKAGFVLMLVCLALFITAIVFMLIIENIRAGVIIAVAGVFLCLAAIILTMFSKTKNPEAKRNRSRILRSESNTVLTEDETDDIIELDKGE